MLKQSYGCATHHTHTQTLPCTQYTDISGQSRPIPHSHALNGVLLSITLATTLPSILQTTSYLCWKCVALCQCHQKASSTTKVASNFTSYIETTYPTILNTPTHILTPKPKGRDPNTLGVFLFFRLHLSGLNFSGSGKYSSKVPATLIGMTTYV